MEDFMNLVLAFVMFVCGYFLGVKETKIILVSEFLKKLKEGDKRLKNVLNRFPIEMQERFEKELEKE
jgi:hypothetical protein